MEDLCRICRKSCFHGSVPIFSDHKGVPLKQMLTKTCPIDITFDDPVSQLLPQSICTECLEVVTAAYNLQQVCIESDQYFRSMVSSDQIVVKTEAELNIEDEMAMEVKIEPEEVGARDEYEMEVDEAKQPEVVTYLIPLKKLTQVPKINLAKQLAQKLLSNSSAHKKSLKKPESQKNVFKIYEPLQFVIKSSLTCDLCGLKFYNKEELQAHMSNGHFSTFECKVCAKKFHKSLDLNIHTVDEHSDITKCTICSQTFKTKVDMNRHIMEDHEKLYRQLDEDEILVNLKCCMCEVDHKTEDQLIRHLDSHKDSFQGTKCQFCPKLPQIKTFGEFYEHGKYHAQPHTHECLKCSKRLPFDEKFLRHVKRHKWNRKFKFQCDQCPQRFLYQQLLDNHVKIKHLNEAPYVCTICAKPLMSFGGLSQHMKFIHQKDQQITYKCKFCPSTHFYKSELAKHEATHSNERPHVCEVCGSSFKVASTLAYHMKMHDGKIERKFQCPHCEKKFVHKSGLRQHMTCHTGEKAHKCSYCDRAYASKGDLIKHIRKVHVGDGFYKCDRCPKAFRIMTQLREHQRDHVDA